MEQKFINKAEKEAQAKAVKIIAAMLQRSDQLDKVEQYRRRIARKKASVEARLKAAVQSQLDGVKTGLTQMTEALDEVKEVKENLVDIDRMYNSCGNLSDKMRDIKDISSQHRQLATAMENLKHIFEVPEEVAKAREMIEDGQLLSAHKVLTDLETSRDDLLYEQHKLENHNEADIKQLQLYFAEAEKLSDELSSYLWRLLGKTMTLVKKDSSCIVTSLRIVEREHRTDVKLQQAQETSGFLPPGRPKRWREKAMETLKMAVEIRVDSDVYETRESDKMWLVRHLEILRKDIVDDLRVAKFLCTPCFPPAYNIFTQFVHWYHLALSSHLQGIIRDGLEGNEIISLLTWLNQYSGTDFMGHPELAQSLDTSKLPALLDENVSDQLIESYFLTTQENVLSWTRTALQQDANDWLRDEEPETDVEGYYRTSLPVILFQMIQQTIQVAETISQPLKKKVFDVCINEMSKFVRYYAEAITTYKEDHFKDREQPPYYPLYMVAATNNCEAFADFAQKLQSDMDPSEPSDDSAQALLDMDRDNPFADSPLSQFKLEMDQVAQVTCTFLLDEVFLDLRPHLNGLFQRPWMDDQTAVETICVTVEDYYTDYVHLRPRYFNYIMQQAERRVVIEYLRAILSRRMKLNSAADRLKAGEKLLDEQKLLASLFSKLSSNHTTSVCEVLIPIAEVIKLQDKSMMSLELSGLKSKYNDATVDQMQALLALRGDFSASQARELTETLSPSSRHDSLSSHADEHQSHRLFSDVERHGASAGGGGAGGGFFRGGST